MKILKAEFIKSAVWPPQYPPGVLPEIAFVGRSNVGKSSLMNTLVGRRSLAKTSNTPGRTQLINFFTVNESISFVDLPGYGFAKVSQSIKKDWGDMMESYLRERQNLAMVILILDIRRDPSNDDLSLRNWLENYRIPYLYVLTKTDKLSNNQVIGRQKIIKRSLEVDLQNEIILFSAKTQKGKEHLWHLIENHLEHLQKHEQH